MSQPEINQFIIILWNITGKTGIAAEDSIRYGENNYGPHALTSIAYPEDYSPLNQDISYIPFNKIEVITDTLTGDTTRKLEFEYGFDQQRKRSLYTEGSNSVKKYFFGDYEETDNGSTVNMYFFIGSPTGLCGIYIIEGSDDGKLYHIFTDHLALSVLVLL